MLAVFNEKFRVQELTIFETTHWIWSLRPVQVTLGSGILSLKRSCPSFGNLNEEEFCDLKNMVKVIESTLSKSFSNDAINYLMLMMVDKHVHYHVVPRYHRSKHAFSRTWHDKCWPGIHDLVGEPLELDLLLEICHFVKSQISG